MLLKGIENLGLPQSASDLEDQLMNSYAQPLLESFIVILDSWSQQKANKQLHQHCYLTWLTPRRQDCQDTSQSEVKLCINLAMVP